MSRPVTIAFLWLSLSASACTRSPPPEPKAVERPTAVPPDPSEPEPAQELALPKVAFLGDSISAGFDLPAEQAFPAVLERRLRERGSPFQLLNAGVSGDTTAGGLRRADWILKQRPDVVVIELGANDGLRGLELPTIEANLRAIIAKVRSAGARPLLLGMRLPTSYGPDYTDAFGDLYPKLAKELDVPVVPFFMEGVAGIPQLNLPDGLHPTPEGHRMLAKNVEDELVEVLQRGQ